MVDRLLHRKTLARTDQLIHQLRLERLLLPVPRGVACDLNRLRIRTLEGWLGRSVPPSLRE
jgi:hypothetical protein